MLRRRKLPGICADSPVSGARFVRPHDWQKKLPDEKKIIGAEALKTAGKTTPPNHLADIMTQLRARRHNQKAIANEISLAITSDHVQKMLTGRPSY